MKGPYITRQLLEREKYYEYGEYVSILTEHSLNLASLIRNRIKRIILLGDAGYGKSTELRKIASEFIEERNPDFVPIYIELNTLVDEDIEEYVATRIGEESSSLLTYDKSKLLFLFDEFDQVLNKVVAARKIRNFVEKYSQSSFVIACRTNFYSGQFEDFENIFIILPFKPDDVQEYASNILQDEHTSFIETIEQNNLWGLARNPFFLSKLIEIYESDKRLPSNNADIFQKIIKISIEKDKNRLANKYNLIASYSTEELETDLMRMSVIMETLRRNYISIKEFQKILPARKKTQIITELSLIKKSFFKDGDAYQFQHNNLQEFLAAQMMANESLETILNFISFTNERSLPCSRIITSLFKYIDIKPWGIKVNRIFLNLLARLKYKRTDRIDPSWVNTLAFLCQLRINSEDLLNYLIKNASELALKFEESKIPNHIGESIFRKIFEKYTLRKIWLDRDIDYDGMIKLARSRDLYDYLMDYAQSQEHFIYRYNAIVILSRMKDFADDSLYSLLIKYATDDTENISVRHLSLYALPRLGKADSTVIDCVKQLKDSDDEMIVSGLYYLISESPDIDKYIHILFQGLAKMEDSGLLDIRLNLEKALGKVTSVNGSRSIITYLREHPDTLNFLTRYETDRLIPTLIKNWIHAYATDQSIYNDIKELAKIMHKKHLTKGDSPIFLFFTETETSEQFFRETYDEGIDSDYSLLSALANEKCIEFLIEEYKKQQLSDNDFQRFINFLSYNNKDNYEYFVQIINDRTGKFFPQPRRDLEKEEKEKLTRKIELIFEKREFIKEMEKLFNGENILKLGYEEVEHVFMERWEEDYQKYNEFVLYELLSYLGKDKEKKHTFSDLEISINAMNWECFIITHIFEILYHDKDIDLPIERKEFIKNFCINNLMKVNFREALTQKGNHTQATSRLAVILWYFLRKYKLHYPEKILLDLLSFDWIENHEYVGIEYLEKRLPHEKIKRRIIENLNKGLKTDRVLENHINYCKKYKVNGAKKSLQKIVTNQKFDTENRLLAIKTLADFTSTTTFLEGLLENKELPLFVEVAKILLSSRNEKCEAKLIQLLSSEEEDFALEAAKLLIKEEQNLEAIRFYANYIQRTKKFEVTFRDEDPLFEIETIRALPILLNLLKFSYEQSSIIEQDEFNRLDSTIFKVLNKIALQNFSNFNKITKALRKFIKKYERKFDGVNFLHSVSDDIEKAFFTNYPRQLTITQAMSKVGRLIRSV